MKMKKSSYLMLLLTCTMFCCKEEASDVRETSYNIYHDSIPKKKNRVKILKLKSVIKKQVDEYLSFSLTEKYIDSLNTAPFNKVSEITYILNEQLEELPVELDSILKTNGVLSRITQIKTYSNAIKFEISKHHRDTAKINKHMVNVIDSYNNLITQLNETSAQLPEDIKKQLEKVNEIKKDTIEGVPLF